MEQTMKELYEATVEGSVQRLLGLLHQDPLILNRCTITTHAETPLHIAAMLGHLDFCSKLLSKNPGLAKELDSGRSSALHLASGKGYVGIVTMLLSASPEMCLAYDGDGYNPLHMAAMKGHVDVLEELLKVRPDAALAVVDVRQKWTILHLCVHYYQFEALKFLVEALKNIDLINAKDYNGNSILHLAVADKQVKTIQYLVGNCEIDVNGLNSNGLTALDILEQSRMDSKYIEIAHCLHLYAGKRSPSELSIIPERHQSKVMSENKNELIQSQDQHISSGTSTKEASKDDNAKWLKTMSTALMVAAALIAAMCFTVAVTPPGGLFSEDSKNEDLNNHTAGQSILAVQNKSLYTSIIVSNTVGFLAALATILLLVSGFTLKGSMSILMMAIWVSICASAYTYIQAITAVVPDSNLRIFRRTFEWAISGVQALCLMMIVVQTFNFLRKGSQTRSGKRRIFWWILMMIVLIIFEAFWFGVGLSVCKPNDDECFRSSVVLYAVMIACAACAIFFIVLYAAKKINHGIKKVKGGGGCLRFKQGTSSNSGVTPQV